MSDAALLWEGRWLRVEGLGSWEYVSRARGNGAAVILAIDDQPGEPAVILVEQWRVPLQAACIELPAGLIGDDAASEMPEVAAARELEEETGYRAAQWRNLGRYASSPGLTDETFSLFEARGLTRVQAGGGVDDEDITVHRVPLDQLAEFIANARARGAVIDVKLLMALAMAMAGTIGDGASAI